MTAHPTPFPPLRGIVPPYLLRHLAQTDEPQASAALDTLTRDQRQRRYRATKRPRTVRPLLAAPEAVSRLISNADNVERLPGKRVREEGQPATGDAAVDEAYDGFGSTWALFHDVYGRNSIDGVGERLLGTVHYGQGYQNAFWNGTRMVFGDGDGEIFGRFTASLDVIGHELTHGVVEHTAALVYSGQSGALNESVADVFGVLVTQYQRRQPVAEADWLVGGDLLLPGVTGVGLRNMLHPGTAYDDPRLGKDPQPASMADYVQTTSDNGGVHYNSGIPNRAFALTATTLGGFAWERAGQIWYDVLTGGKITADCSFAAFAALTIAAAVRRYGKDSGDARAVADAWRAVGVEPGAARGSKAPGKVDPQLALGVERSGGITGRTASRQATLAELPSSERRAWQGLLTGDTLPKLAAGSPSHPDTFVYQVSCAGEVYEVPELSLPDRLKKLLDRFLGGDS
ncbi:MAG: metalloprotease [Actinobacteria bacterium HGW-Actinobacteria-2]|nr:MAG: metalloprotease [Actinobacteria bacterium HGW-Actinobacteria-2]